MGLRRYLELDRATQLPLSWAKRQEQKTGSWSVEIAWGWVRFQPESTLTQWYQTRFGQGSARLRKIGMVALARKLLIALWRFLKTGEFPAGAVLKAEMSG